MGSFSLLPAYAIETNNVKLLDVAELSGVRHHVQAPATNIQHVRITEMQLYDGIGLAIIFGLAHIFEICAKRQNACARLGSRAHCKSPSPGTQHV